ncbi:MAG: ABC transporter ATP-binding protein [Thermoplasmata archaeon]
MADNILKAVNLSKWYGEVIGLNTFNLEVKPGITGIVGPNGAGKSTLFKLSTGMIKPNTGDIKILGEKPWLNNRLYSKIGFCPDYDNLPDDSTGYDFLRLTGGLKGMEGGHLESRIEEVVSTVGMKKALGRKIGGYSKGMRQRIKLAGALLHDPDLLFLDEPLSGADPKVRKGLINVIKELNTKQGHDIIVTSHVLYEIERMTRDVALIYKGRAVASGDISEIRGLIDKHPHNIIIKGTGMGSLAKRLIDEEYVVSVRFEGDRTGKKKNLKVEVTKPDDFFTDIPAMIAEMDTEIDMMYSLDDNLEAVFKYLVGGKT